MEQDKLRLQCMFLIIASLKEFLSSLEVKRRKRRFWVRPIFLRRSVMGAYDNLVQELRQDPEMFHNYCRMSVAQFDELLTCTKSHLQKYSQREPIPPGARLMLTLRYLAAGSLMKTMSYEYRIGASTVSNIIKETCEILWNVLSPVHLKSLNEEDWKKCAEDYYEMWDMPNCVGAVDGKHVNIKAPACSGSNFFNYKKTYSIVLLAVCDAHLKFTNVDIGGYGGTSDGGILRNSEFGQCLHERKLKLPPNTSLPGDNEEMPFYIVGDEAFPLGTNLMRPYGGRGLSEEKRIFNYRLSRARRCIENAFGVLVAKWRIFHTVIEASATTVDSIIKATVVLHNYLITSDVSLGSNSYITPNLIDQEDKTHNVTPGMWRNMTMDSIALLPHSMSGHRMGTRNAPRSALLVRDYLMEYVCTIDPAPWQTGHIRRGMNPDNETD